MTKTLNPALKFRIRPPVIGAAFVFLIVLISVALSTHSLWALFSLEGLMSVVGGVIAVAFMSFPIDDVKMALQAISRMFREESSPVRESLRDDMMEIVAWSSVLKQKGIRSLETSIGNSGMNDHFVQYASTMIVSGYKPEDVRVMLETAADSCYDLDSAPINVLHAMASHAPAFGMIGTLVGMVAMLCNLNGNMANIGPSLAISFLSTLYGVISARMIYLPAASRLQQKLDSRHFRYHLITEGMVMLMANKNPMYIQDHLNSFLRPDIRNYTESFNTYVVDNPRAIHSTPPSPLKIVSA